MKFPFAFAFAAALLWASAAAQQEKVIVYPVEAISDSAILSRAEFNKAYAGIDATQFGLTDEGWYVRYQHERLTYLYGPVNEINEARRQKKQLEEIRLTLVLKNPKLSSSKIDIVRFEFSATPNAAPIQTEADNPYLVPELSGDAQP